MSKRRFKAFLSFNWQWLLLIFVACSFFFYYLFDVIKTPGFDERVSVFIGVKQIEAKKLSTRLYDGLEGTKIKEVFIDYSDPKDSNYTIVFSTRGLVNTDIIIMSTSYLEDSLYSSYFSKLNCEEMDGYFNQRLNYFNDSNGDAYGIRVTKAISKYSDIAEDYYVFFNKKSDKLGAYGENNSNSYGLEVVAKLLYEENL